MDSGENEYLVSGRVFFNGLETIVVKQRLSYPTETVLSIKITRNRIVLSFKDSPRKPLKRRPIVEPPSNA